MHIIQFDKCPSCGKAHTTPLRVYSGKNAVLSLPEIVNGFGGKKVFFFADHHTYPAAGERVLTLLRDAGFECVPYVIDFEGEIMEPDEHALGRLAMHFDHTCDVMVTVGSGVLNDISKPIAQMAGKPYIIVGTAPSMDGYASASSSMVVDGLKCSLNTGSPTVIIGDTDILKTAPLHMLKSGLGDMLAKYVAVCEWRFAPLITGEAYCEEIAKMVRSSLKKCIDNAEGLLARDDAAIEAVFEGLVISGITMYYAGHSRTASGLEHYVSHILDMRGLAFGTPFNLHGIQCAVGTLIAAKLYEQLLEMTPDREKALAHARAFDLDAWNGQLRAFLGAGADAMIAQEKKDGKYDLTSHEKRIDNIVAHWEEIKAIIREELPSYESLYTLCKKLDMPTSLDELGQDGTLLPTIFKMTKDIRFKYILSTLAWDMGVIDEFKF